MSPVNAGGPHSDQTAGSSQPCSFGKTGPPVTRRPDGARPEPRALPLADSLRPGRTACPGLRVRITPAAKGEPAKPCRGLGDISALLVFMIVFQRSLSKL